MSLGNIFTAKELAQTYQPLLLCEFTFRDGQVLRVSTHPLSATFGGSPSSGSYEYGGNPWLPRVMNQDVGATQAMSELGVEIVPQVTIVLADPDKTLYTAWEAAQGFKGATLKLYSVMWDAGDTATGSFTSNSPAPIKFIGTCNSPSFDEKTMTVTATSLLNMSQIQMPPIRIQQRCSWSFPTNATDRQAAKDDPSSIFYECGYSYGLSGGVGNPETGTAAFRMCTYDFDACVARLGDDTKSIPIIQDKDNNRTGRFGGFRWIPQQSNGLQRSYLTGRWEEIINATNEARYGDFVPMCYGTTWVEPLVMGAWGDGNYSSFEVLIGYGQMSRIKKVVVNGQEVAKLSGAGALASDAETDTTKNGWWGMINDGSRDGYPSMAPGWGGQGDPYGSLCAIYVNVLNQVAKSSEIPRIQVLLEGTAVRQYTDTETYTEAYSSNPVWILMDLLIWSTWKYSDIDIQSFIDAAAKCDQQIYFDRMDGTYSNYYSESGYPAYRRYSVGFSLRQRVSIGELLRGVRNSMGAMLFFDYVSGKLKIMIKETLASQQPSTITGSNYNDPVPSVTVEGVNTDGYVAYKFDHSNIIKREGKSTLQVFQKVNQDAPNKVTVAFQNRENSYSQDTATIVDTEDVSRLGQEVFGSFPFQGGQTFDHVRRITNRWFAENYRGNDRLDYTGSAIGDTGGTLYFELETTIKSLHLMVGHICLLTDLQHGFEDILVRVTKIQPSSNFETARITLCWHNDNWYQDSFGQVSQPRYARRRSIVDRKPFSWRPGYQTPDANDAYYSQTDLGFGIRQEYDASADGSMIARLRITGRVPINSFPDTPGRPKLELVGVGTTGGGYPTDKTYYVGVCATGNSSATLLSPMSKPLAIPLESPSSALSFVVQHWPDSPSGYVAFAGENPFAMTYQASSTATPSSIVLTNTYNEASWGAPDEAFVNFRWRVRRLQHAGVWGSSVLSVTSSSITVPVFTNWGFTTNEWAGRVITVLGVNQNTATLEAPFLPIANFTVASNTSDTLVLSSGDPTTCVGGDSLQPGDAVVMRYDLTYGEDANGKYFEDALNINRLNPVYPAYEVTNATNANPIVVTVRVPPGQDFPYSNGDVVVVQGVLGNTAANGGWVAASVNTVNKTLQLTGAVGNGAYTGGGTISKQVQGFNVDEEVGRLAFIIAGTGRGTYAKIKSNTDTRCYIEGDWTVTPDSTSQIIILDPVLQEDVPSEKLANNSPDLVSTFDVDVTNYNRQSLFVQVAIEASNGDLSYATLDPFREIFLFGSGEGTSSSWSSRIVLPGTPTVANDVLSHRYRVKCAEGNEIILQRCSSTAKTNPSTGDAVVDILYSRDGGATFTSIFNSGDANKAIIVSGNQRGEQLSFANDTLQNDDQIRVDVISNGSAAGLEIVLYGREVPSDE